MMKSSKSKMAITLLGRSYNVACAPDEERRLGEIVTMVETKLQEIAANGGNASESRLFMLACLLLADEVIETRKGSSRIAKADEDLIVAAVEHLTHRVVSLAQQVGHA